VIGKSLAFLVLSNLATQHESSLPLEFGMTIMAVSIVLDQKNAQGLLYHNSRYGKRLYLPITWMATSVIDIDESHAPSCNAAVVHSLALW